jgi:hypothetical protein
MIQIPQIDLNGILPVAGLALIAIMCVVALLLNGLLRSRIALLLTVIAGVVLAGPTLANALTNIVWALVPLGVVLVAGGVVVLWLLNRNPELMALARDIVPRKEPQQSPPLELPPASNAVVINQPQAAPRRSQTVVIHDRDRWGF